MTDLSAKRCEACRADAPLVTPAQIEQLRPQIPAWDLTEVDGMQRLTRAYQFKNFEQALDFTNQVGALAEQENHHPAILTEWGSVTVSWWTHKIKGLHMNDFVMAAKTDAIAQA